MAAPLFLLFASSGRGSVIMRIDTVARTAFLRSMSAVLLRLQMAARGCEGEVNAAAGWILWGCGR